MKTVVMDTNVLLADPNVLLSYPRAEIVIPETVLQELDKLKTSRVDADLRFRGREVSRILFEFSEQGSLIDGVELPDGGSLRVVPLESDVTLPDGLSGRNSDDRILAVAILLCREKGEDCDVTLITNDLNMLLKAQTYGVPVERHGEGAEGSFLRRFVVRPFQRYKVPVTLLTIALAVFAAVLVLTFFNGNGTTRTGDLPEEFTSLLDTRQREALEHLAVLDGNPNDRQALGGMADIYYDLYEESRDSRFAQRAVRYYEKYLLVAPNDLDSRTDFASALFYTGQTDAAIQQALRVLEENPDFLQANFNLGLFYWQGRRDYPAAIAQYDKVIALTEGKEELHGINASAKAALEQVKAQQQGGGTTTGTSTGGGIQ